MNISDGFSVQFGCGLVCPDGWLNYDVSPTLVASKVPLMNRIVRLPPWKPGTKYGNIVKGLPLPERSCVRVYCDQVLEHLSLEAFRKALHNVHRIMKPGGVYRLFVPDMEYFMQNYLADKQGGDPEAAHKFVIATGLGLKTSRSGLSRIRDIFGNSHHLWGWDEASMKWELTQAGFSSFRRIHYRDSDDPMFKAIEDYSEFKDCRKSLGVEVRR